MSTCMSKTVLVAARVSRPDFILHSSSTRDTYYLYQLFSGKKISESPLFAVILFTGPALSI